MDLHGTLVHCTQACCTNKIKLFPKSFSKWSKIKSIYTARRTQCKVQA